MSSNIDHGGSGVRERIPQPEKPQKAPSADEAQQTVKSLNEQESDKDEQQKKTYGRTLDGKGAYSQMEQFETPNPLTRETGSIRCAADSRYGLATPLSNPAQKCFRHSHSNHTGMAHLNALLAPFFSPCTVFRCRLSVLACRL